MTGDTTRPRNPNKEEVYARLEAVICKNSDLLIDSEEVSRLTADTNAGEWRADIIPQWENGNLGGSEIVVPCTFELTGTQLDDEPYAGDRVTGSAMAIIDSEHDVSFRDIDAEIAYDD